MTNEDAAARGRFTEWIESDVIRPMEDFQDPKQEWRRLFSELLGTFFLVLVAAGGGMMSQAFPDTISRAAAVTAPGLMVLAIILFMGKVSGAHLNPAVSLAFAARGDFPWRRVPGYIVVQLGRRDAGRVCSCSAVIDVSAKYGSNYPAAGYSTWPRSGWSSSSRSGLVSVILGTASGAQNIGIDRRVRGRWLHRLAGLWGSPISGTSMNPARTFGPDLVGARLDRLLGVRRRTDRRRGRGGRVCVRAPRPGRRQGRVGRRSGRVLHRGRRSPTRTDFEHDNQRSRSLPLPIEFGS